MPRRETSITKVDGETVESLEEVRDAVRSKRPGDTITLVVERGDRPRSERGARAPAVDDGRIEAPSGPVRGVEASGRAAFASKAPRK